MEPGSLPGKGHGEGIGVDSVPCATLRGTQRAGQHSTAADIASASVAPYAP